VVSILLRRRRRDKSKHGGDTSCHQPARHLSRSFQVSRLRFPRIFK
jgi:hypothetical protein